MADGTPDVQGPAKLPGNPDGIDLDAVKASADRAAVSGLWPYSAHYAVNGLVAEVEQLRTEKREILAEAIRHKGRAIEFKAERDAALARIRAVEELADKMDDEMVRYESKHNPECECDWIPATAEAVGRFREAVYPVAAPAGESANPDCAPSEDGGE